MLHDRLRGGSRRRVFTVDNFNGAPGNRRELHAEFVTDRDRFGFSEFDAHRYDG